MKTLSVWVRTRLMNLFSTECDKWIEWNQKEYKFTSREYDWTNSKRLCGIDSANLVTIEDEKENKFVFEGMLKCIMPSNSRGAWIGWNDLREEGTRFHVIIFSYDDCGVYSSIIRKTSMQTSIKM